MRSTLWTGRPLRALATPYIRNWELNRRAEIDKLQGEGQIVLDYELDRLDREGKLTEEIEDQTTQRYFPAPYCDFGYFLADFDQADGLWCCDGLQVEPASAGDY